MYEPIALYYDQLHNSLTADIDFIRLLAAKQGGLVLELGCGSGRILLPLLQDGLLVTGVDNSPAMIELAYDHLSRMPESVRQRATILEADIRDLPQTLSRNKFGLVLLPYNTLLHFRRKEVSRILCRIRDFVRGGTRLLIDVINPFLIESSPYPPEPVFETSFEESQYGQRIELWSQAFLDAQNQMLNVNWIFRSENDKSAEYSTSFTYHYLYPHEYDLLLKQAGFRLEQMMGDYNGDSFNEDSERLLMVAEMPVGS